MPCDFGPHALSAVGDGRAHRFSPGTGPVLCFDRGGWPPALLAGIADAGFDLLTYRKNDTDSDIPDLPGEAFTAASWAGDDGRTREYDLADTTTHGTNGPGHPANQCKSYVERTRSNVTIRGQALRGWAVILRH